MQHSVLVPQQCLSKRALRNVDYEMGTYLRFLFATIIMLIIAASTGDILSLTEITTKQIIIFLIIAFTTGGAAIFLYYYGLKRISASVASICELAFPLNRSSFRILCSWKYSFTCSMDWSCCSTD
ncbi:MAG: DMT family transporter [Ignavibacteriales bacterium]|nr:DMT family transporter [Ignavibacteriales bacterium]